MLLRSKRTHSCPPKASSSVISGPWSLEWLHDQAHGEEGVIFSSSRKAKKGDQLAVRQQKVRQSDPRKWKGEGLLRHPFHSIKKVARLPSKDRSAVLKILKSMFGVVEAGIPLIALVLELLAVDDIWGIGKAIGVKFKRDNVNMFRVLSRAGK
ncbi:hypothetical protein L195_g053026, partial [Trifolium pratense]